MTTITGIECNSAVLGKSGWGSKEMLQAMVSEGNQKAELTSS